MNHQNQLVLYLAAAVSVISIDRPFRFTYTFYQQTSEKKTEPTADPVFFVKDKF